MSTSLRRTALLLAALTTGITSAQIKLPFQGGLTGEADYGWAIPLGSVMLFTPRTHGARLSLNNPVTLKPLRQVDLDIDLPQCEGNVALSPDGNVVALSHYTSDGDGKSKEYVLVYDLKANKTILDFEGPNCGLTFLNNDRLYTSGGVVLPRLGTQEAPDLPNMEVYARAGDYLLNRDGSIFSLSNKAFVVKGLGKPEGQPFGSLMLYRKGDEGDLREQFRVVNIQSGQTINEFKQADVSIKGLSLPYITLVDNGRVAAVDNQDVRNNVYVFDLSSGKSKLYLSLPESVWNNNARYSYDTVNRRLFTPGGQYINFR